MQFSSEQIDRIVHILYEYHKSVRPFAIFPNAPINPGYIFLGLIGEIDEFDDAYTEDELGDILFYTSFLPVQVSIPFESIFREALQLLNKSHNEPSGVTWDLMNPSAFIRRYGNYLKKIVRGDATLLQPQHIEYDLAQLLAFTINSYFVPAQKPLESLEVLLMRVAEKNYNKLNSRARRGVLRGSGDDR